MDNLVGIMHLLGGRGMEKKGKNSGIFKIFNLVQQVQHHIAGLHKDFIF